MNALYWNFIYQLHFHRYPEILDRQLAVFTTYSQDSLVRTDLEDKINAGFPSSRDAHPVILNALLCKTLLPVSTTSVYLVSKMAEIRVDQLPEMIRECRADIR